MLLSPTSAVLWQVFESKPKTLSFQRSEDFTFEGSFVGLLGDLTPHSYGHNVASFISGRCFSFWF